MISFAIDFVLITALAVTSVCVLTMYRRLRRFDALQGEAAKAFAGAADALEKARWSIASLQREGDDMAVALAARLNEARLVLNDMDAALENRARQAASPPLSAGGPCPAPPPIPTPPRRDLPPIVDQGSIRRPTIHCEATQGIAASFEPKAQRWTPPTAKIRAAFGAADAPLANLPWAAGPHAPGTAA